VLQPSGAQLRMQTPLAAAVRAAVISAASITAIGNPVSGSFTIIRPEMYGRPRCGFAGYPETHLMAARSPSRRYAGIAWMNESGRGWIPGFGGSSTFPWAIAR
jgi:hypothetical protein